MVAQAVLPFQYVEDPKSNGATALGGLPVYMELAVAAGLRQSVARHVGLRGPVLDQRERDRLGVGRT